MRHLLVGLTTRALAESARRADCDAVTVDYFGDLDTKRLYPNLSLRELGAGYSASALARLARELHYDAVTYAGGLENHPEVVAELAEGKILLGNSPAVLRQVRNPALLFPRLAARGFSVPATIAFPVGGEPAGGRWLVKPVAGGGGLGVRPWRGQRVPPRQMLQERISGVPASAVFVANGRQGVLLGWSRQLHAPARFRYGGNVLPLEASSDTLDELRRLIQTVTEEFGLVGLNGIDFVLRAGRPVLVEVNPRYSASMELVERATDASVFALHLGAFEGRLPAPTVAAAALNPTGQAGVHGKAIVYARQSVSLPDPSSWIERGVRDVPHPGEVIRKGHPICTVFAAGPSVAACLTRLRAAEAALLDACAPRAVSR
ncbi:MAG TPA: ATP-grasp domain-containing protein [Methylomirabilota bacterium]